MNAKILKTLLVLGVVFVGSVGCTTKREVVKYTPMPHKTLIASGFGTVDPSRYSFAQGRLMGMRASKMEAYRSLAEQIYGLSLNSNTTVENMVLKSDSYRSYVDAIVRGARVKRISAIDKDTYETVLEIDLSPKFFECFGVSESAVNRCLNTLQGLTFSSRSHESDSVGKANSFPKVNGYTFAEKLNDSHASEQASSGGTSLVMSGFSR